MFRAATGRLNRHKELLVSPEQGGKYLGYGFGTVGFTRDRASGAVFI